MSKKSQSKQEKCLICQKPIKLQQTYVPIFDIVYDDIEIIPSDKYININCSCLSVYNKDAELIGLNKSFIREHGEA